MKTQSKLSTLWIIVMFNLIFADVLSLFIAIKNNSSLDEIIGEVTTTMAIAAVLTNIPILMIYFSKSLPIKLNKRMNYIAVILTLIFVIGGGSLMPHYLICAGIEVICLVLIFIKSWKWQVEQTLN